MKQTASPCLRIKAKSRLFQIFFLLVFIPGLQPCVADSDGAALNQYGPVKTGDTLSNIAYTMYPGQSYPTEQIMWAIFNNNTHAFMNNDINNLKQGALLKLPSPQMIEATDPALAKKRIKQSSKKNPAKLRQLQKQLQNTRSNFDEQLTQQELLKLRLLELEEQAKKLIQQNSSIDSELKELKQQITK